jgi:hypothetical protein
MKALLAATHLHVGLRQLLAELIDRPHELVVAFDSDGASHWHACSFRLLPSPHLSHKVASKSGLWIVGKLWAGEQRQGVRALLD